MESSGKIIGFFFFIVLLSSCTSGKIVEDPLALLEVTPLPKSVVIQKKTEYEPVYGVMRVLEVSEENGVQKYLLAKAGDIKSGLASGVTGDIGTDAAFGTVIGTFKIVSVSNGFVKCVIENVTQKVPGNAFIRIQTGQKEKEQ
jgi:hypothetical protein